MRKIKRAPVARGGAPHMESCDAFPAKRSITFCPMGREKFITFYLLQGHPRGHFHCIFFNLGAKILKMGCIHCPKFTH